MVPRRIALLACSVVLVTVLTAGVGAAGSHVAIEDEPTNQTLGDVVELTLSVPENGTATVVLESTGEAPYDRTIVLTDTSGDGVVTLRINTFLGQQGTDGTAVYSADDGDAATVRERSGTAMSATEYDIAVYNGTETDGEPADTTAVELTEPTDGSVTYLTGPRYASSRLETSEDIRQGRAAGWLNESSAVTTGETLVLALEADGLGGAVAASDASNDTERFHTALDRPNTTLEIELDEIPMLDNPETPLNRSNIATAVTDRRNDTYYAVIDTSEVGFVPERNDEVEDGDAVEPELTVAGRDRLTTRETTVDAFRLNAADGGRDDFEIAVDDPPENGTLGDVVELGLWLPENETATVVVEATGADGYGRTVRLTDASGDGRVRLRVNTFLASQGAADAAVYSVGGGDNITVRETVGSAMAAREYRVAVYGGPTTDGEAVNSSVTLAEPSDGTASVSVAAPNASARLDTREDIQRARREGRLTKSETVAAGDTVVFDIRVDGLGGALAAEPGDTDSERFLSLLDRANTTVGLEWGVSPMTYPSRLNLSRRNVETVVTNSRNDTYYVVVDTTDAGLVPSANEEVDDGDDFELYVTIAGEQRQDDDAEFDLEEAEAELSWSPRVGQDGDTVRIDGRTNMAPGSRIRVHLTSTGTNVTTVTRPARSDEWTGFNVTVPADTLSEADSVRVHRDGTPIETETQRIQLAVPSDQSIADGQLRVPSVWLPADGYVHVVGPEGTVVGRSDELRGEREHNVTIPLSISEVGPDESLVVVPSREVTINSDDLDYYNAFFVDGAPPGVTVNVTTVSEPSTTPSPTTSSGTAGPASTTPTGAETTAADGPGFGALTALVAGLLALAAGTLRRR